MRSISPEATGRPFLARQHVARAFKEGLTEGSLSRFASDTEGIQLDWINIVARRHELTLWSRLEFFGGLAMMPELFTRPVAFILSGEMAVA